MKSIKIHFLVKKESLAPYATSDDALNMDDMMAFFLAAYLHQHFRSFH